MCECNTSLILLSKFNKRVQFHAEKTAWLHVFLHTCTGLRRGEGGVYRFGHIFRVFGWDTFRDSMIQVRIHHWCEE